MLSMRHSADGSPRNLVATVHPLKIITMRKVRATPTPHITFVSYRHVAASSENRPVGCQALNRFVLAYEIHLLFQIKQQQETFAGLVAAETFGGVPGQRSVAGDCFSELSADESEGMRNAVAAEMEPGGFEGVLRGSENELQFGRIVQTLLYVLQVAVFISSEYFGVQLECPELSGGGGGLLGLGCRLVEAESSAFDVLGYRFPLEGLELAGQPFQFLCEVAEQIVLGRFELRVHAVEAAVEIFGLAALDCHVSFPIVHSFHNLQILFIDNLTHRSLQIALDSRPHGLKHNFLHIPNLAHKLPMLISALLHQSLEILDFPLLASEMQFGAGLAAFVPADECTSVAGAGDADVEQLVAVGTEELLFEGVRGHEKWPNLNEKSSTPYLPAQTPIPLPVIISIASIRLLTNKPSPLAQLSHSRHHFDQLFKFQPVQNFIRNIRLPKLPQQLQLNTTLTERNFYKPMTRQTKVSQVSQIRPHRSHKSTMRQAPQLGLLSNTIFSIPKV